MFLIRKKDEVRISAFLALFNIPISIVAMFMVHGVQIFEIFYLPASIASKLAVYLDAPDWFEFFVAVMANYLAYFLLIYLSFKILRILNISEEEPGKDQST